MKTIELTQGKVALVDDEDYALVSQYKWQARKHKGEHAYYAGYSGYRNGKCYTLLMHRLLMGVSDSAIKIDHIDRDGLNNQRGNLRVATNAQNSQNQRLRSTNKTGFKGVHWSALHRKYRASICFNSKVMHIGLYATAEEASRAYEKRAAELYGDFYSPSIKKAA